MRLFGQRLNVRPVVDDVGSKLHVADRRGPLVVPCGRPILPNGYGMCNREVLSRTSQIPAETLHTVFDTYLHFENVFDLDIQSLAVSLSLHLP